MAIRRRGLRGPPFSLTALCPGRSCCDTVWEQEPGAVLFLQSRAPGDLAQGPGLIIQTVRPGSPMNSGNPRIRPLGITSFLPEAPVLAPASLLPSPEAPPAPQGFPQVFHSLEPVLSVGKHSAFLASGPQNASCASKSLRRPKERETAHMHFHCPLGNIAALA